MRARKQVVLACVSKIKLLVGLDGLEPSTSRLSGARSNHLSYRPVSFGFLRFGPVGFCRNLTGGDDGNLNLTGGDDGNLNRFDDRISDIFQAEPRSGSP